MKHKELMKLMPVLKKFGERLQDLLYLQECFTDQFIYKNYKPIIERMKEITSTDGEEIEDSLFIKLQDMKANVIEERIK